MQNVYCQNATRCPKATARVLFGLYRVRRLAGAFHDCVDVASTIAQMVDSSQMYN